ncbi:Mur ligase domain-containing protein, partial [Nocardioides sp.]|uniref:Mur ligase domain-containing protein n=1 Tax=Nocardioides sp. TaxID=35761 RepID=UPI00356895AD
MEGSDVAAGLSARPVRPPLTPFRQIVDWLAAEAPVHADGDPTTLITGISLNSTRIVPGDLYAALPGAFTHGAEFARQALASGAVAVLTDSVGATMVPTGTPVAVVDAPRPLLGSLAAKI